MRIFLLGKKLDRNLIRAPLVGKASQDILIILGQKALANIAD